MNDKQMLELAAKAAGHTDFEYEESGSLLITTGDEFSYFWNPLSDDGDALRLAVKLHINLILCNVMNVSEAWGDLADKSTGICIKHADDPYAATRRAITRAAAEIGRAL